MAQKKNQTSNSSSLAIAAKPSAKVEKAAAKPAPAAKKEPERQLSIDEQIS
jgi:hypothetical protein